MQQDYTTFDRSTGRILSVTSTDDALETYLSNASEDFVKGRVDGGTSYIDPTSKQPLARSAAPFVPDKTTLVSGGTDMVTFSGLPNPAEVYVKGSATQGTPNSPGMMTLVSDGTAQLSFNLPGTYTVTVRTVPYLDAVFTLTAT